MEIALASKRKLGFVTGAVKRDKDDPNKADMWDTANNMVISWIMGSVSPTIAKSILFINSARDIWTQLERRFLVNNAARKYMLNKAAYDTLQNGRPVSEYFTDMKAIWEELESLSDLPPITHMTPDINGFVKALEKNKKEQHLFQFLVGLDDDYGNLRS
ncbi:Aldehyde dehydrogenase family 9 member A1-A [Bienertia sinuspersici]